MKENARERRRKKREEQRKTDVFTAKPTHTKKQGAFSVAFGKLCSKIRTLSEKPALFIFVCATVLCIIMEALARHNPLEAVMFLFRNPVAFLLSVAIVALTMVPSLFFKKRFAVMSFIALLWFSMAVTNFIICFYRITPFSAMDITLITSVFSIIEMYFSIWGIILVSLLILGALYGVIIFFIKSPASTLIWKTRILCACKVAVFFSLALFTAVQSGSISGKFTNLGDAYESYGFTYCFSASVFSRGITRPTGYSQEAVEEIDAQIQSMDNEGVDVNEKNPNIILVQLESYFDLNYLNGITFSQDPVPTFTELKKNCPTGSLKVPSLGAGTANTEFEVLTGMDKAYFGIGEYPYKTILQNNTCESICYNLKNSGYSCHAIHNHYGTFYDRNKVFANLGFDTFTPIEHMTYVPTTPKGWEKDEVLPDYIKLAMDSTQGRDFVFAISVQAHGKYPTEPIDGYDPFIKITDGMETDEERIAMEYYASMIYETDMMMQELISAYEKHDEPVMIVFYGDHMPNIELSADMLKTGDLLSTEYAIWTNYDLKISEQHQDLTSYQLSSYIMELCDKNDGVMTKIHQAYRNAQNPVDYSYMLEIIEYDMLYGDNYITTEGREHYLPTDIKIGISEIKITGVDINYDEESQVRNSVIKGQNFTVWSVVKINGHAARTVFKDSRTLLVDDEDIMPGDVITVAQVAQNNAVLSETTAYTVPGEKE